MLAVVLGLLAGSLCLVPVGVLAAEEPKVLVIGFDGMDPDLVADFRGQGLLPTMDRLLADGWQLENLGTSIPPQSPVAWSNFITGMNPGEHGIFDFIHRDPETLTPFLSTSEAKGPTEYWKLGSLRFPRGEGTVINRRQGTAFWQLLDAAGVDATVFKVPANFPPVECEARTLSGMGTPDILGTYGIFNYITDDGSAPLDINGGNMIQVTILDGHFRAALPGPQNVYRKDTPESAVEFEATVDRDSESVLFRIGDDSFLLRAGEWSDWVDLDYVMLPVVKSVAGICRFHLIDVDPVLRLYVTPVQIDPRHPEMPLSTPEGYARELAEDVGLFYTQGLPEDTKALDEGILDDEAYVGQSNQILDERLAQFEYELDRFARLESGFLFFYFNSPDQSCHMFWRNSDPESPMYATADPSHRHRIRDLYVALDKALGQAVATCGDETLILVMSDHGFAPYHRNVHLNAWLRQNGYLYLKPGVKPGEVEFLEGVDWRRTRAYAVGINGLYLNIKGREARGIVRPGKQREQLLAELTAKLEATIDPASGKPAIKHAYRADQVYSGEHTTAAPDIVMGYHRGWRCSNETALGAVGREVFDDNLKKWSGDHCIAADEVPGIILTNGPLTVTDPDLKDLAPTILQLFGLPPAPGMQGRDLFGR